MVTEYWPKDTKKWDQWVDFIDLARKYDEATGQKECQDPEKIKVLGNLRKINLVIFIKSYINK